MQQRDTRLSLRDEALVTIQEIREWKREKLLSIFELTELVNRVAHDVQSPIALKPSRMRALAQGTAQKITPTLVDLLRTTLSKVRDGTQSWRILHRLILETQEEDRRCFYEFLEKNAPYPCGHLTEFPEWLEYYEASGPFVLRAATREIPIPAVIEYDNTQLKFSPFDMNVDYSSELKYELSEELRAATEDEFQRYLELTKNRPSPARADEIEKLGLLDDAPALRLSGIEESKGQLKLMLHPVSYADYVRTHLLIDQAHSPNGNSLRRKLHPDGYLPKLGESSLADVLGIDILLLTSDGYLVLADRSSGVLTSPCKVGTSVSGTFAPEHLLGRRNILDMITGGGWLKIDGMGVVISNGELFTETHLQKHDISEWEFLGVSRDLIRAGQPSMVFFAATKLDHNEIHDRYRNALEKHETAALQFVSADVALPGRRLMYPMHVFDEWVDWLYRHPLADATPVLMASVGLLIEMLRAERSKQSVR
jgi:hypothetical protein